MKLHHTAFIIPAVLLAAPATAQGLTVDSDPQPVEGRALFSHAVYDGRDSICRGAVPRAGEGYFSNPLLPGWYSDPTVCAGPDGDYWLATSTFAYWPGVPLFHSRDLVNWTPAGHVLDRESQLERLGHQGVSGGIFAPDLKYCPVNGTYYMITTNVGAGNFLVKAHDPRGPWSDPVYLPQIDGIDPSLFFDNDGRAYIVNCAEAPGGKPHYDGHRTVRLVEYDLEGDSCKGERTVLVDKGWRPQDNPIWCEGPHLYRVGGMYYLMTAEGGTGQGHSEVIYRSKHVRGPYEAWEGNPILTQRDLDPLRLNHVTCTGHADLVQTPAGQWWAVFLACRPNAKGYENTGRETFMLPVEWTPDGWPVILGHGREVPLQVPCGDITVQCNSGRVVTEFDRGPLPPGWLTLRGPATRYCTPGTPPGWLAISCAPVPMGSKQELPYVGRRLQHPFFDFSMRMVFEPATSRQCAGLAVMKDETHQYHLVKRLGQAGPEIAVLRIGEGTSPTVLATVAAEPGCAVDFKVKGTPETFSFYYSADSGVTWTAVAEGIDAAYTSTQVAGGFTGTTVGAFASSCL